MQQKMYICQNEQDSWFCLLYSENTDVVNIKRGIISALQTQMNTNSGEEEDSTGKHKSLYT